MATKKWVGDNLAKKQQHVGQNTADKGAKCNILKVHEKKKNNPWLISHLLPGQNQQPVNNETQYKIGLNSSYNLRNSQK